MLLLTLIRAELFLGMFFKEDQKTQLTKNFFFSFLIYLLLSIYVYYVLSKEEKKDKIEKFIVKQLPEDSELSVFLRI
jgi:uncharacterized protein (UPF0333 family)